MNLKSKIRKIPYNKKKILDVIRSCALQHNIDLYFVGGIVRDLILNRKKYDFDFCIDGNMKQLRMLVMEVMKKLDVQVRLYPQFFTAKLILGEDCIDFSCPRREKYLHPGDLPRVERCSLKEDVLRRDFTINTLYLALNKDNFGEVIELIPSALEDIRCKLLRVLHKSSFLDDPTRVLRGIRFEQELGFRFERKTYSFLKNALAKGALFSIDETRIKNELDIMFSRKEVARFIKRIDSLCGWDFFCKEMKLSNEDLHILGNIDFLNKKTPNIFEGANFSYVYYGYLLGRLDKKKIVDIATRFGFTARLREICVEYCENREKIKNLKLWRDSVKLFFFFKNMKKETRILFLVRTKGKKREKLKNILRKIEHTHLCLRGKDLKKMGIQQGPMYSRVFRILMEEKVKGRIRTKSDEIAFIETLVHKGRIG